MAIRQTKKISELNSLTSASLNTFVLGVDNGSTYKITLDVLEDAVINMVSRSTDLRLDALESYTASANDASDISSLNSFTSSQTTLNNAFTNGINGRLQTSSFNSFSASVHSEILAATNEQSFNGLISGSSQLTSSYDSRYVLSGSITQTTWDNISGKPSGLVSQSTDLSSLNSFTQSIDSRVGNLQTATSSYETNGRGIVSGSSQLTSSFDLRYTLSGSVQNITLPNNLISSSAQITGLGFVSGSYLTSLSGALSSSAQVVGILTSLNQFTASNDNTSLNAATSSYETKGSGIISGSSQLTTSFDLRYATSASYLTSLNGAFSSSIQTLGGSGVYSSSAQLPNGLVSGSSQLTSSYDTRYTLSGSVQPLPNGVISGSSQLTSSYDTRYALSGSGGSIPGGTISGSSQLTSSFDGRYVQTGSFNTLTASFNSFTASAQSVTTGSNSFNGTQTITGSLIITTGSFVASQILANTSSLYLTSGSNMYVQNNGVVEITGSLRVSGSAAFNVNVLSVDGRSGDEGGEINLAIPVTNTTLQNRVTVDIFQNRYRIFEGSADAKGVYIDLSKAPAGNSAELLTKVSGLVGRGTDVTLGNLKVRFASTGNMSLQVSTVTGTYSVYGSGIYTQAGTTIGTTIDGASPRTISTTPAYLASGYNFGTAGATDTWVIMDTSNTIAWRITMIVGAGFSNNFISIERLH